MDCLYLVETKALQSVNNPSEQRKLKAAQTWCERINALPEDERSELPWHHVLLGEAIFHDWRIKGGRLDELLAFARIRPVVGRERQQRLELVGV